MVGPVHNRFTSHGFHGVEGVQSLGFLIGLLACLALASGLLLGQLGFPAGPPEAYPGDAINPNDAPVASLIRLPGVGLTRAQAIVAHRDTIRAEAGESVVFCRLEDLQQVKGIGPGITQAIRPWLRFDPP